MARLLFTTEDMRSAASQMGDASLELVGRIPALAPAGMLMPPALEVEAVATLARVSSELVSSSAFYAANAVDLAVRAAEAEAAGAGDGVMLAVGRLGEAAGDGLLGGSGWGALLPGLGEPIERVLPGLETPLIDALTDPRVGRFFEGSSVVDGLKDLGVQITEHNFESDLQRFLKDPADEVVNEGRMAAGDRDFALFKDFQWLDKSPLSRALDVVAVAGDVGSFESDRQAAFQATSGDDAQGQAVAVGMTETVDLVSDVSDFVFPPYGIADALTGGAISGALRSDAEILGGGVSGAVEGYKSAGLSGAVKGLGSGTMQASTDWRDLAEQGKKGWAAKRMVQAEDWVISL